jgi:hypothetical protein
MPAPFQTTSPTTRSSTPPTTQSAAPAGVEWLTAKQLADQMGVDHDTVLRWRKHGLPSGSRIPEQMLRPHGNRWRFAPVVVQFIEAEQARYAAGSKRSGMLQDVLGVSRPADAGKTQGNTLHRAARGLPASSHTSASIAPESLHSKFSHTHESDRLKCAAQGGIPERLAALGKLDSRACLKPTDAAALLDTCTEHLSNLVEEGRLKAIDISSPGTESGRRCLRIPVESLAAFLTAAEVQP